MEESRETKKRQSQMQQGRTMALAGLEALLQDSGLLGGTLDLRNVRSIAQGLQRVIEVDDDDSDSSSDNSDNDEPSVKKKKSAPMPTGAVEIEPLCFNEFIDALAAIVLYKDKNPFLPFMQRFERLIMQGLLWPLRKYWLEKDKDHNIVKILDAGLHEEEGVKRTRASMQMQGRKASIAEEP